LTGSWWWAL